MFHPLPHILPMQDILPTSRRPVVAVAQYPLPVWSSWRTRIHRRHVKRAFEKSPPIRYFSVSMPKGVPIDWMSPTARSLILCKLPAWLQERHQITVPNGSRDSTSLVHQGERPGWRDFTTSCSARTPLFLYANCIWKAEIKEHLYAGFEVGFVLEAALSFSSGVGE